jgi:hypothetical protein
MPMPPQAVTVTRSMTLSPALWVSMPMPGQLRMKPFLTVRPVWPEQSMAMPAPATPMREKPLRSMVTSLPLTVMPLPGPVAVRFPVR